jgi:hypothetical protein
VTLNRAEVLKAAVIAEIPLHIRVTDHARVLLDRVEDFAGRHGVRIQRLVGCHILQAGACLSRPSLDLGVGLQSVSTRATDRLHDVALADVEVDLLALMLARGDVDSFTVQPLELAV